MNYDPPVSSIQERQANRMRPLDVRMQYAEIPFARGQGYPTERLLGGVDPEYVHPWSMHLMVGSRLRKRVIHNPLFRTVNRPMTEQPTLVPRLNMQAIEQAFRAGRGLPVQSVFDPGVVFDTPEEVSQRIATGGTLYETHSNLEYSGANHYLRKETGDIWRDHSTVDPWKAVLKSAFAIGKKPLFPALADIATPLLIPRGIESATHMVEAAATATARDAAGQVGAFYNTLEEGFSAQGHSHPAAASSHRSHVHLRIHDAPINLHHLDRLAARALS